MQDSADTQVLSQPKYCTVRLVGEGGGGGGGGRRGGEEGGDFSMKNAR